MAVVSPEHEPTVTSVTVISLSLPLLQEGFRLMQQQRTIFECRHAAWEDEYWSVMQASHVMVNSSHNLAAFMARYQGVDWRNTKNWDCNSRWGAGWSGCLCSSLGGVYHTSLRSSIYRGGSCNQIGVLCRPPNDSGNVKHRVQESGQRTDDAL